MLAKRFMEGEDICSLVTSFSNFCDNSILSTWHALSLNKEDNISLIALGSLGRRELLPYSDIDLLILHPPSPSKKLHRKVEEFVQALWDQGFRLGHQVATLDNYLELAAQELSVVSSLFDMRYLNGSYDLYEQLHYETSPHHLWSSPVFFKAKWEEQNQRHKIYNESAYNLEPNLKNGPGGLRDIQMILWIAARHFGDRNLTECLSSNLITENEFQTLKNCQQFLWRVRFALHIITNKDENRILFNYQKQLALILHSHGETPQLAIENFMTSYFSVMKSVRELNDLLLQLFREIIFSGSQINIKSLGPHFQMTDNYLEVKRLDIFSSIPSTLFTLFLTMIKYPQIKGVRANTIRLLSHNRYLIDDNFRNNPLNAELFMQIMKESTDVFDTLKRMNRYGLLSRYIPEFGLIIGKMQYDLFHAYTVDQHSLFVIRNIMRFKVKNDAYPLCNLIYRKLPKKELLVIAALFHDIAKGRGGCHSTLGSKDAISFCLRHGLSKEDSDLVAWLVQYHLLLSHTAQRKDIYEAQTIEQFCIHLKSQNYLDYLYLLTVADICATNTRLWNSWKASLLKTLYIKSSDFLIEKLKIDETTLLFHRKQESLELLPTLPKDSILTFWATLKSQYFLHQSANEIATQTRAIIHADKFPIILVTLRQDIGGAQLLVYTKHIEQRVSITTTVLSNFNLNIVEARIMRCANNFDLDTYTILNQDNTLTPKSSQIEHLKQTIAFYLSTLNDKPKLAKTFIPRRQRHRKLEPKVSFVNDKVKNRTLLTVIAADRKGLLASLSYVFSLHHIQLQNAKIITTGEQVEDSFILTDSKNESLDEKTKASLKKSLLKTLRL